MKIRLYNIHKGIKEFDLTTKQANMFQSYGGHYAVTFHNVYWDTKTDKVRTSDMRSGKRQSNMQCVQSYVEINGAWQQLRIFSVDHDGSLATAMDIFRDLFSDMIVTVDEKKKEIEAQTSC